MSFKQLNIQIHHPKLNYSYRVVPPSKLLYNPPFHYKKTPQQWNWRSSNTNSPNKLSINIHPAYSYYFGYVYQYPIKPVGGVSSPTAGRLVMASPSFSWPKPSPVLPMRRGDHRPGRFSSAVAKRDMIRAWRGSDWGNRENGGIWRMGHLWTKNIDFPSDSEIERRIQLWFDSAHLKENNDFTPCGFDESTLGLNQQKVRNKQVKLESVQCTCTKWSYNKY